MRKNIILSNPWYQDSGKEANGFIKTTHFNFYFLPILISLLGVKMFSGCADFIGFESNDKNSEFQDKLICMIFFFLYRDQGPFVQN